MCQISDYSACGHQYIDRTSCTSPNPMTHPCEPLSIHLTLPSECPGCLKSYLRTLSKRCSVVDLVATPTVPDDTTESPQLFAWPQKSLGRGPLRSNHLATIPESPRIVREEKSLPPLPQTARIPYPQATSTSAPAPAPAHTVSYPPSIISNHQQTESLPPSLSISRPQYTVSYPPRIISNHQQTESLPLSLSISRPQHTVRAASLTPQQTERPQAEIALHPIPAARFQPTVDRNDRRLKPRNRSNRLRDAFQGTETSHTPAVAPPAVIRKPLNSNHARTTLPSENKERKTEHTPTQELFLTTPVKEIDPVGAGLPSSLQPVKGPEYRNISRASKIFNNFGEGAAITTTKIAYIPYSGVPAVKSLSELPNKTVEFVSASSSSDEYSSITTTPTPNKANSLLELSAISKNESQIELEKHSRLTTTPTPSEAANCHCHTTTTDSKNLPQLPNVRPVSPMAFCGSTLDGIFETWTWT